MTIRVSSTWWRDGFFDPTFYTPADETHCRAAVSETRFVARQLRLRPGARVLDLCCGPGRHALLLARQGCRVTGLDFSRPYLEEGRRRARKAGLKNVRWVRGDMRSPGFAGEFDAAFNLYTSFGYFELGSENLEVLRGVLRALRPGGLFLLDVVNGAWLTKSFKPVSVYPVEDGSRVFEESELVLGGRKVRTRRTRVFPDGRCMERSFSVWLFDRARLETLLRKAGFAPLAFWGSLSGAKPSPGSSRVVALARKPPR